MSADEQREIKANYTAIRDKTRSTPNGHPWDISPDSALDFDETARRARYETAWEKGGLRFRAAFRDMMTSLEANETAAEFIRAKISQIIHDPAVAERLTPRDHPVRGQAAPDRYELLRDVQP